MSTDNKILFDELISSDLNYFSFYLENVVKAISSDEERAQSLSGYLCSRTFQFNYRRFARNGERNKKVWSYMVVKDALREKLL